MAYKQKIIKSFNSGAYSYNRAVDIQPQVARKLSEYLPGVTAKTILEIGSGTGLFSQYLPQYFPAAELWLTDIAPNMLEFCQERMCVYPNIRILQMDGEQLTLPNPFDLIVSCMTFHWFADIELSLQKIMAKLPPHGRLIFAMLGENSLAEWREICAGYAVLPTPSFISPAKLQRLFPEFKIAVELSKQFYRNAYEFLKTLKLIGANAPHADHSPETSGSLRRLMRVLDKKYPQGIDMSYEIIYGSYEKI